MACGQLIDSPPPTPDSESSGRLLAYADSDPNEVSVNVSRLPKRWSAARRVTRLCGHPIPSTAASMAAICRSRQQPTFEPAVIEQRFTFAYDVLQQHVTVSQNPPWIAQLAVGQLRAKDGFVNDPRNTVESLAQCVITGNMYRPYLPTRTDIRSESLSIDGRSGWLIDSEITVDRPDLQVTGDHVIFIVVRDGKDWGFFFGAVPIGNARLDAVLATTIRGLRAS